MNSAMRCLRAHFFQYEIGLRRTEVPIALRIGSAWASAMEARWNGLSYEQALTKALPEGIDLDAVTVSTISALLFSYYKIYGNAEKEGHLHPEVQFKSDLDFGFTAEGKMDGLGSLHDGRSAIIEGKTTADSLAPDSDYWLRLAFNLQIYQYVVAAREANWPIEVVFYDVCRKPSIRPKNISDVDTNGLKIVLDAAGNRVLKKNGEPKQTAGEGETLQQHVETPEEFAERLIADINERPEFYFARKEVPILDDQIEAFKLQRMAISKMILSLRENENGLNNPADAWPRHVDKQICGCCQFKSFCLNNINIDFNHPPEGFTVGPASPELEKIEVETESIN